MIQYVYQGQNCRLMLIGDKAQLPPIGEEESPALMASVLSLNGVAMGDPSGLPSSFPWLVYAVFAATYFVLTFVIVYVVFVCYYMYGTIEKREEERKAAHEISKVKITEGEL